MSANPRHDYFALACDITAPASRALILDTSTEAGRDALTRWAHIPDEERAKWAIKPLPPSGLPGGVLYSAREIADARLKSAFAEIDAGFVGVGS